MQCSVTTVNKIMYNRGFVREKHGWKCLSKDNQRPRMTEPPLWIFEKRTAEVNQEAPTLSNPAEDESIDVSTTATENDDNDQSIKPGGIANT